MLPATRISRRLRKPPIRRRKAPTQARAVATVDALLLATAELIETRGYAQLTTNHIAQRAGVSIGSLYQYFPSKEALCHALAERHFQRHTQRYLNLLEQLADAPVEQQVRELVRLNFVVAREDPGVARGLYAELSRFNGHDPLLKMREAVTAALTERYSSLPVPWKRQHPDKIAFIITVASSALVGEAVARRPEWLEDEAYIELATEMVLGYYQRLGWLYD